MTNEYVSMSVEPANLDSPEVQAIYEHEASLRDNSINATYQTYDGLAGTSAQRNSTVLHAEYGVPISIEGVTVSENGNDVVFDTKPKEYDESALGILDNLALKEDMEESYKLSSSVPEDKYMELYLNMPSDLQSKLLKAQSSNGRYFTHKNDNDHQETLCKLADFCEDVYANADKYSQESLSIVDDFGRSISLWE
ncbi:hypothetical protein C9J03_16055 [Photobacterium gaetbulicola]|nr:hypothetical protein [Photobacterium gaetbulicola]PSU06465.1 hypothetical protein C9J03_16055 [Photobacterium gaetbulicola]